MKWLKYFFEFIACYAMLFLLGLWENCWGISSTPTRDWLGYLILVSVFFAIRLYFAEINPRCSVLIFAEKHVWHTVVRSILAALCVLGGLAMGMELAILVPDNTPVKALLLVLWMLFFPVAYYVLFYRGISLYRNQTLRVFNLRVRTYRCGRVEDVRVEPLGAHARLTVSVGGEEHVFWVPTREAWSYARRISNLTSRDEENE